MAGFVPTIISNGSHGGESDDLVSLSSALVELDEARKVRADDADAAFVASLLRAISARYAPVPEGRSGAGRASLREAGSGRNGIENA